ncbi:MAG: hypothetical protein KDC02_17380, partial [Flavobacteriales bacterium]|nr:hypothetical protein [Flavobacteriales bacterium]
MERNRKDPAKCRVLAFTAGAAEGLLSPCSEPGMFLSLRTLLLTVALSAPVLAMLGQQNNVPLQRDIYLDLDRNHARIDTTRRVHTGMRPYIESRAELEGVLGHRPDSSKHYYAFTEKLFKEHLFIVDEGDVHLTIDPVFQFELGQDFRDTSTFADTTRFYHNARGFLVRGDLGPRFSFETSFYENQAIYPGYLYSYTLGTEVVPGQGRVKGFKNRAFDFAFATGNFSWTPARWLNVQFGNGKHFVGNGYRSMLLSDNAFNYPYLKFSLLSGDGRWQYTTFHAKLTELQRLPTGEAAESLYYWKRMRVDHLSVDLGRVQLGLFESTIFRNIDADGVRPFDPLELNPVIGVNSLLNGLDGEYNVLLGLDLKVKVTDRLQAYGQVALDDPATDRIAWQAGLQAFDLFGKDLHARLEYNRAAPYTYQFEPGALGHRHYNQPLAHPMGAYFDEVVVIVDHRLPRFLFEAKVNLATYHLDEADSLNFGGNVLKPYQPVTNPEGPLVRRLTYVEVSAAWLMNQMT